MALSNTQYDQIKRMYDQKLLRRHYEIEKRTAYVNEHVEGYKELSDAISSLSIGWLYPNSSNNLSYKTITSSSSPVIVYLLSIALYYF